MSPRIGFAIGLPAHPTTLPTFRYAWLEAPLAARLAYVHDVPNWHDLHAWPAGRLFGTVGEYRWQQRQGGLHAVLLLEADTVPAPFSSGVVMLEPDTAQKGELILWGEWVDPRKDQQGNPDTGPRFYANEIPRIQTYPLELHGRPPDNATARLQARYYHDKDKCHGAFVRCVDLFLDPTSEEG